MTCKYPRCWALCGGVGDVPSPQPPIAADAFHAEKHCLDSFLVAQRPVVGCCERVDDHPGPLRRWRRREVRGADIVSPCTTILAGSMPFATATASSSLARTSVARAPCLLTHSLSRLASALAVYRSVRSGMTPASSRILVGGRCCSVIRTPRSARASSTALVIAAGAPIMPPSPTPR
jgi:hypothetical protein